MADLAEADVDDLEEGVGVGGIELELGGELGEEEDLDGGTGGVPVGAGDAVAVCDGATLEQRGWRGEGEGEGGSG